MPSAEIMALWRRVRAGLVVTAEKFAAEELVLHVLEHEIHHRGELSPMLGLPGRQGLDA